MKKQIFSLGLMLAAAFTLTNCAKEEVNFQQQEAEGTTFEIVASTVATKTTNNELATEWVAGDAINLFHAVTDEKTTYTNDGEFSIAEADLEAGKFKGTLNGTLDVQEEYDWYAFYPYSKYINTPANTTSYMPVGCKSTETQTQSGNNSMAHIAGANYPLAGKKYACSANATPDLEMSHVTCLLEVVVKNVTDKALTVSDIIINAPENLVGTYYINFSGEITPEAFVSSGDNYVSKTAKLTVKNGTALAKDASAKFYLAVKPFKAAVGKTLSIVVNGYKKQITLANDVEFAAGQIKTLNFTYDNTAEAKALSIPWVEDFSSKDLSNYVITSGGTTTALYTEDPLAGGSAPEILISKDGGSLTATLATDGYAGNLTLLFKSNHADYVTVTATGGVTLAKVSDSEYTLTVPEGLEEFSVTLKNSKSSNTRVDDIEIALPRQAQTLAFATESYAFVMGSSELASFVGQTVSGNKTEVTYASNNEDVATVDPATGAVTMTGESGTAVITASAVQTSEYKAALAAYSIVVSNPSATVVEKTVTYNFGKDTEVKFSSWNSSYTSHTASYADATVTFKSANKQSSTITDCPVTKGSDVTIVMGDGRTLKSFNLTLKKWSSKAQTVTLHYSKDGGATYTKTSTTSSTFALAADVPEGTNAIKFTFSSTSNQVGIVSCELTFDVTE